MRLTMPRHTYARMYTYPLFSKQLLTLSYSSHGHPRPFKRRRGPDHKQTRIKLADPLQLQSFRPECFQAWQVSCCKKTKSCFGDSSFYHFEYRANRGWNLLPMFQFPFDMLCTFILYHISRFFAFSYRWLHLGLAEDHLFQCNFYISGYLSRYFFAFSCIPSFKYSNILGYLSCYFWHFLAFLSLEFLYLGIFCRYFLHFLTVGCISV